jgi:hypothetical protein
MTDALPHASFCPGFGRSALPGFRSHKRAKRGQAMVCAHFLLCSKLGCPLLVKTLLAAGILLTAECWIAKDTHIGWE